MAGGDAPKEICGDNKKHVKGKKKTKKSKCQATADSAPAGQGSDTANPYSILSLDIGVKVKGDQSKRARKATKGGVSKELDTVVVGDILDTQVKARQIAILDSQDSLYQLVVPGTQCVLELQCVCEEMDAGSSQPTVVEQYNSRLIEKTDHGEEEGSKVCRRQYQENATKSSKQRTDSGGEECEASSTIQYTEQERVTTTHSGQVFTEKSVRTEENHKETTSTYELVDDQLLKKALTRRRPSVSSASTSTTMDTAAATTAPGDSKGKYIVSFNSDTSDSEDDSADDVTTSTNPAGKYQGLMNGHVDGDASVSRSITLGKSDDKPHFTDLGTKSKSTDSHGRANGTTESNSEYSSSVKHGIDVGKSGVGQEAKLTGKDSIRDRRLNRGDSRDGKIRTSEQDSDLDLTTSGSDNSAKYSGYKRSGSSDVKDFGGRKHSYRKVGSDKVNIDTDLLIDIDDSSPQVSPEHSNMEKTDNVNSDLYGLSMHYSPKTSGTKVNMDGKEDISGVNDMDYKIRGSTEGVLDRYGANTIVGSKQGMVVNGIDGHDLSGLDITADNVVAMENKDKTDLLDADLLIYASPGTTTAPAPTRSRFNFSTEETTQDNLIKTKSLDYESLMDDKSYRGKEKVDRQVSMPEQNGNSKGKYKDLDEKFSAICSKYGRDRKRDKPHEAPDTPTDTLSNDDIYGAVRVRTGALDGDASTPRTPTSPPLRANRDEDSGFSEETETRTPRQKLTFDDVVNWDKSSTDDLIKRILSDARDESSGKFRSDVISTASRDKPSPQYNYESRYKLPEPYEKDMGGSSTYGSRDHDQPSLLERRLASLGGRDKHEDDPGCTTVVPYNRYEPPQDDDAEPLYKRRSRRIPLEGDDDDAHSVSSTGSNRYVPWKQRQKTMYDDDDDDYCYKPNRGYRGGSMLAIPSRYDDSDSDNESYVSRRSVVPILPDEAFMPQRSEDTADVVKDRTAEVRNMVDNQAEVLGRLKKAHDSFDDLDAEIKQLKQQVIENQAARQAIMEDIIADIQEDPVVSAPAQYISPYSYQPQRYSRGSLQRSDNFSSSYVSPYTSSYTPRYGRKRDTESCCRLDSDIESDRLGGYALGAVAKSKWGEPGGSRAFRSASVSRFDNVESERFDRYGLYNADSANTISKRLGGSSDDYEVKSDFGIEAGDDAETASIRSYPSEKNDGDGGDDDESGSTSKYRSRASRNALSKYTPPTSYEPPSRYGSSITSYSSSNRPSRSVNRSYTINSGDSSYERPRTRGTSMPPLESKPFTSRFLSKVREKKEAGVDIKSSRDKPFKSRFLAKSFDSDYYSGSSSRGSLASTPDKNSSSPRSFRSSYNDVDSTKAATDDVTTGAA